MKPMVCDTAQMLYVWCEMNGFISEEGGIMDLPPEAVIAFHDFLDGQLKRAVEMYRKQLEEHLAINLHPPVFRV